MIVAEYLARTSEGWKSGPIGLAVILALCVASYFLFKSMSKHLRKVREDFPVGQPKPPQDAPAAEAAPEPVRPADEQDRPATPS